MVSDGLEVGCGDGGVREGKARERGRERQRERAREREREREKGRNKMVQRRMKKDGTLKSVFHLNVFKIVFSSMYQCKYFTVYLYLPVYLLSI